MLCVIVLRNERKVRKQRTTHNAQRRNHLGANVHEKQRGTLKSSILKYPPSSDHDGDHGLLV